MKIYAVFISLFLSLVTAVMGYVILKDFLNDFLKRKNAKWFVIAAIFVIWVIYYLLAAFFGKVN